MSALNGRIFASQGGIVKFQEDGTEVWAIALAGEKCP